MKWLVTVAALVALLIVGQSRAARPWHKGVLKVGVIQQPKTLNPWLASDVWSFRVVRLIYQPLYVREPRNLTMTPWLASGPPEYNAQECSYTVTLREAKWSDGHPVTARDVVFTAWLIKKFKVPRFYSLWEVVKKAEPLGKRRVKFWLNRPRANFLSATLSTPIVPRRHWAKIAEAALEGRRPLIRLMQARLKNPIGCGPFVLKKWRKGTFLYLEANRHFFGRGKRIAGRRLGPYISGMIIKIFGTSDAGILALRKGTIDLYWGGIQPGYLLQLQGQRGVKLYRNAKNALYFMAFNLRRPPFKDRALRRAVATLIDKDFIIRRVLQSSGLALYTLVLPSNAFYFLKDAPAYGRGSSRKDRIKAAFRILTKAGYTWERPPVRPEGKVVKGRGIRTPDGKRMKEFYILTPPADYDPQRAMCGVMIQEWLRMVGIPGYARPMSFGALVQRVKVNRDFSCFVMGYSLRVDPDYLRRFFHSKRDVPRGWNVTGYHNREFDRLAVSQVNTIDRSKRREMVLKMQRKLMRDLPMVPLYNPALVEGVRVEKFRGWVPMLGGVGNLWSFCTIRPRD